MWLERAPNINTHINKVLEMRSLVLWRQTLPPGERGSGKQYTAHTALYTYYTHVLWMMFNYLEILNCCGPLVWEIRRLNTYLLRYEYQKSVDVNKKTCGSKNNWLFWLHDSIVLIIKLEWQQSKAKKLSWRFWVKCNTQSKRLLGKDLNQGVLKYLCESYM